MMSYDERVGELRKCGYSITRFAESISRDVGHVQKVLAGKRESVPVQKLFAEAIGKTYAEVWE